MISHKRRILRRRFTEALRRHTTALAAICFFLAVCCGATGFFPKAIKRMSGLTNEQLPNTERQILHIQSNLTGNSSDAAKNPISDAEAESPVEPVTENHLESIKFTSNMISRLSDTKKKENKPEILTLAPPDSLQFKNNTNYSIIPEEILSGYTIPEYYSELPQILIIHTHATEAYTQSDGMSYVESDPYRTTDNEHNMVKVGSVLAEVLAERGIRSLHDETLFDYPNYNGSYTRSMDAIEKWLEEYPSIRIVLDIHRDAIEYADGSAYRTSAFINDAECAQILIISGTDYSGLYHPDWRKNLGFGLYLQARMDAVYPGLTRPLKISEYRYNMQATPGSLLIEVGSHGNTLTEALAAVRLFGNSLADLLLLKCSAG